MDPLKLEAKTRNQIKLQTITYTIVSSLSDSFEAWASPARIGNRDEPITKALGPNHSCWVAFDESIRYVVVHKVLRCTQKKVMPEGSPRSSFGEEYLTSCVFWPLILPILWSSEGLRSDSALTCAVTLCALSSAGKRTVGASDWCLGLIALVGDSFKN